ncbi:hypothetical protein CYMTET_55709 [Cymbomonas tetramitiformis]|uniref:Magnesium transporter n=1 Tax=Cymbomonas tetramitiformis TaxID=36881 RepID=A0AAE0EPH3_9CHLO|nr:hypothetical protein CYMTET_55709 [Cymbomonas tetramitiformis]
MNSGRAATYEVARVTLQGASTPLFLGRRELLRQTGLQPRELRRIDPSLTLTTSTPTIVVRSQALLLHLGAVRLIVTTTHAFLFDIHSKGAKRFLNSLSHRLAACTKPQGDSCPEAEKYEHFPESLEAWPSMFYAAPNGDQAPAAQPHSSQDPVQERDANHPVPDHLTAVPFELEVVEAALLEAVTHLEGLLSGMQPRVTRLLRTLPTHINATTLEELRSVKQLLVALDSRAGTLRQMLLETLDDEEDIAGMMISKSGVIRTDEEMEADEEEVEGLLEYYLQRCDRRLEVNKLELALAIVTFAVAMGALVTGIFGMNLRSRIEEHATAFYFATFGIVAGISLITAALLAYTKFRGIL